MAKDFQIPDLDTSWRDGWVGAVIKGLSHAHVSYSQFGNFVIRDISVSLIRIGRSINHSVDFAPSRLYSRKEPRSMR